MSVSVGSSNAATSKPLRRADRLTHAARVLRPVPTTRSGWVESAAVFLIAAVVAYLRLGRAALRGVVWAEDGQVFLAQAHQSDLITGALKPYNGYALLEPRVLVEVISWFPLAWQGRLLSIVAALCTAAVALLAYHVARAHARTRVPPLLATAVVAAPPVGIEVVDNLANSQWFLLAGAVLVVFWEPARRPGRWGSALLVFVATTTCVFAGLAAVLAVAGWLVDRRRSLLPITVAGFAGVVVQGAVSRTAPPRIAPLDPGLDLRNQVAGYVRRVVGDGVLGSGRHGTGLSPSLLPGLVVTVVVAVLVIAAYRRGANDALALPAMLTACSLVLYAAPVYLTQTDTAGSYAGGRYWVAPVILLVVAISLVAEHAWLERSGRVRPLRVVLAAASIAACVFGLVTSWRVPSWDARETGPSWQSGLDRAEHRCTRHPERPAVIRISPPGWSVTLTCRDLR